MLDYRRHGASLYVQLTNMDAALWIKRPWHRAGADYCSSRWDLTSNSVSDDKANSTLHFPHRYLCDLLHSPLGTTVILSSAENLLKKYLTSPSSHRQMTLLYSCCLKLNLYLSFLTLDDCPHGDILRH